MSQNRLPCQASLDAAAFGDIVGAMVDCGAAPSVADARARLVRVFGLSSAQVFERDALTLPAAERNLAQKTIALQKAIDVLAPTQKAAGAGAARRCVARAVAAEAARLASTGMVYSVGAVVGGAVANQDGLLADGAAARGGAALAADVANLVEASVAVAVGCLLRIAPNATLTGALEWSIDPVLRCLAALQMLAQQCAAAVRAPSGEPQRLLALVRSAGMGEELEALAAVTGALAAIPPAAARLPRVLESVNYAMLGLVGSTRRTMAEDGRDNFRVRIWQDRKEGGAAAAGALHRSAVRTDIRGAMPAASLQP